MPHDSHWPWQMATFPYSFMYLTVLGLDHGISRNTRAVEPVTFAITIWGARREHWFTVLGSTHFLYLQTPSMLTLKTKIKERNGPALSTTEISHTPHDETKSESRNIHCRSAKATLTYFNATLILMLFSRSVVPDCFDPWTVPTSGSFAHGDSSEQEHCPEVVTIFLHLGNWADPANLLHWPADSFATLT